MRYFIASLICLTVLSCGKEKAQVYIPAGGTPGPVGPAGAPGAPGPKGDTGTSGTSTSTCQCFKKEKCKVKKPNKYCHVHKLTPKGCAK
jgi:hypothetical protein